MSTLESAIKTGVNTGLLGARVAYPAFVNAFDAAKQVITAQVAIMQIEDGVHKEISLLVEVPILIPTVNNYHITLPIKEGDEVLCVFADRCIDAWLVSGEISQQNVHRVHNINDGFAIIGVNSYPNVIPNYNTDNLELRNTARDQYMSMQPDGIINIDTTNDINVNTAATINATAADDVNVTCTNAKVDASASAAVNTSSATINTDTMDITCSASFTLTSPTVDINAAAGFNVVSALSNFTVPINVFTGTVAALGYGAGGATPVANTMTVDNVDTRVSLQVQGQEMHNHTHIDAEGRPTGTPQ